jgi:hypothetical protein
MTTTKTFTPVPRPAIVKLTGGTVVSGADVKGVGTVHLYGNFLTFYVVKLADGTTHRLNQKDQTDPLAAAWLSWASHFCPNSCFPNRDCPMTANWAKVVPHARPPGRLRHNGFDVARVARHWQYSNKLAETHASVARHCGPYVCKGCGAVLTFEEAIGCKHTATKSAKPECRAARSTRWSASRRCSTAATPSG